VSGRGCFIVAAAFSRGRGYVRYNTRNMCNTDNTRNTCVTHYTPSHEPAAMKWRENRATTDIGLASVFSPSRWLFEQANSLDCLEYPWRILGFVPGYTGRTSAHYSIERAKNTLPYIY
jgi:hypothetical protein